MPLEGIPTRFETRPVPGSKVRLGRGGGHMTTPDLPGKASEPAATGHGLEGPPELAILGVIARPRLEERHRLRLQALLEGPVDWPDLLSRARRHHLSPLLALHLKPYRERIPPGPFLAMEMTSLANAGRMLRKSAELARLLDDLEKVGIRCVPYKGPTLGAQLYGSPLLRQSSDLDLLVAPTDARRARAVLLSRGYRPRHLMEDGADEFMFRSRYSETFEHDTESTVELHWRFTNGDIGFPLTLPDLEPRLGEVRVGRVMVPAIGTEDLLLVLCVHGSKHRWDRLEWICGLAELVRAAEREGVDPAAVVERASRLGIRRMVLLGLLLAGELLEAPVGGSVLALARGDRVVARLAGEVRDLLEADGADEESESGAVDRFRYLLRERPVDRLRFLWYRATTPSQPERWRTVTIGGKAFPVHALARPVRIATRLWSGVRLRLGRGGAAGG